jgi:hypothetical protein
MKNGLTVVALVFCSCQQELVGADLDRLTEFFGCCHSQVSGWSEDGTIALSVYMPEVDEPGEYLEQFTGSAVQGVLRHGKNFGDGVDSVDTGEVVHDISVIRVKYAVVSGSASIKRTPWDSWNGEGQPGCDGLDVLDLTLVEPVFEDENGRRSFRVGSFEFPPLCVGWMPM